MVGRDHLQAACLQAGPQAVLMKLVTEGWRHHTLRGMVPVRVRIHAFVEEKMLDQWLAEYPHAFLARSADGFMGLFTGNVNHIKRHAGHVGDHYRPVGGLTLDLRRSRIGMGFGPAVPFFHQLCLKLGDDIAVLSMNKRHRAKLRTALEAGIHLVVIDHKRALVGHEMLEGIDSLGDHFWHFIEYLLTPPCDRHVEGVVGSGTGRLVVPGLYRGQQRLVGCRKAKIHDHCGAAR